jgi:pyridoxamine 5'-phosphate oxidase
MLKHSMNDFISKTRIEYTKGALDESHVASSPVEQFKVWFAQAQDSEAHEPNACAVATVGVDGKPSLRMVLLKAFDDRGFTFFTNYDSTKGKQLAANAHAAMTFYWPNVERQVRIEGVVEQLTDAENDAYFYSRPRDSQFGSAVSTQSRVAGSREELEKAMEELRQRVGDGPVPRPPHWGGYRISPVMIEFWQGRENRLHDRIRFRLQSSGTWSIDRLWP